MDGYRFIAGAGQFPEVNPIDISLPGVASWVVALPWMNGSLWAVTLENGQVFGYQVNSHGWQPVEIKPQTLEAGQPPILSKKDDNSFLLIAPSNVASPLTHSIPILDEDISQVYIDTQGNLVLVDHNLRDLLSITVNVLPDARILSDGQGRLLFLSVPTEKYDHGVLGDSIEAGSITRIDDPLTGEVSAGIVMPDDLVIEGISPIWVDLNSDGELEIIVTVSNVRQGAQILVFSEDGHKIAAGPDIGQGYRWRHQIAVAPFGPSGEIEIADLLTPHLGGVVEFYQLEGDQLKHDWDA